MGKKIIKKKTAPKVSEKPKAAPKVIKKKAVKKQVAHDVYTGLHNLKIPQGAHKRKKLLGRGSSSGHGKTSTRGSKGQTSRAGRDFYAGFEGGQTSLIRRMPKRGFTNRFREEFQIVNITTLAGTKEQVINPELLLKKGIVKDKRRAIKILGDGEIKNAITVSAHAFSKSAAEKIKNAGGKIEIINGLS
ncbi:MAG: 50S ribosomal protein L15 [Candidatus Omnitrophica bacterium]|nr:50S ribosomal protein L15 [Candidatus Omnitrophota bacterium]